MAAVAAAAALTVAGLAGAWHGLQWWWASALRTWKPRMRPWTASERLRTSLRSHPHQQHAQGGGAPTHGMPTWACRASPSAAPPWPGHSGRPLGGEKYNGPIRANTHGPHWAVRGGPDPSGEAPAGRRRSPRCARCGCCWTASWTRRRRPTQSWAQQQRLPMLQAIQRLSPPSPLAMPVAVAAIADPTHSGAAAAAAAAAAEGEATGAAKAAEAAVAAAVAAAAAEAENELACAELAEFEKLRSGGAAVAAVAGPKTPAGRGVSAAKSIQSQRREASAAASAAAAAAAIGPTLEPAPIPMPTQHQAAAAPPALVAKQGGETTAQPAAAAAATAVAAATAAAEAPPPPLTTAASSASGGPISGGAAELASRTDGWREKRTDGHAEGGTHGRTHG